MTVYELAVNMYNNAYDNGRLSIEDAEFVLREYRFADEDGDLEGISAEDLVDEYNDLIDEHMRINEEQEDEE